jgi:iron complex outermembrane receptor protein
MNNLDFDTGYRRQVESSNAHDGNSLNISPDGSKINTANAWDAGLKYKFSQHEKVYLKYNQSFRFPNIDEFWGWNPDWLAANPRIFNSSLLSPQVDRTYQVGGDFLVGPTKISASIYHTETSNQIRYETFSGSNINDPYRIERKGLYLSTISPIGDKLTVYTNSNLQDVSYTDGPNSGQSVPLAPHFSINARLTYKVNENWSLGTVVNYVGDQYYAGANDLYNNRNDPYGPTISNFYNKIPSYTVADIYASYKAKQWDARITVKNIANSHYATYGGINTVTMEHSNSMPWSYYYYPSDPRSVFASVSYNF